MIWIFQVQDLRNLIIFNLHPHGYVKRQLIWFSSESKDFDTPVYKANKEVDDLSAILPDIKAKIEDCEDERKNMDQLKNLAKDALVGNTLHSLYNAMFGVHGNGLCYKGTILLIRKRPFYGHFPLISL